ncbi:MAG TPA: polyhydroxyalkanoic acid system family protein [Burkholderiaceae bacterium]|jgi:putative polyhydroxyalkanoate system protein|nr:polyhydroxyalkanoic acid system family protein [Burkholderiaceae bacterium]
MADIHIHREHHLGLKAARKIAFAWAEEVERDYDLECEYAEGDDADGDEVRFSRTGVKGTLAVTGDAFELRARLGLLAGAFRHHIEAEIVKRLDERLAQAPRARPKRRGA